MCVCPPLCDPNKPTTQILAKAYPSPRELEEVKGMGVQGIASSMCPIHTTDATGTDPLYGYRPAVSAIVDRLKNALANQCLPQQLTPDPTCGNVPCLILETLSTGTQDDCGSNGMPSTKYPGLTQPDKTVLDQFNQSQHNAWAQNGGLDAGLGPDPSSLPTCEVTQLVASSVVNPAETSGCTASASIGHYNLIGDFQGGTCAASSEAGWCYVQGKAAGGSCPQAILFSPGGNPVVGAQISLECIVTAPTVGENDAAATGD
jgi:hypothetical protein